MPYGIKGKTKKWEKKTKIGQKVSGRIEKCVSSIMADPDFKPKKGRTKKESAIAICKTSITRSDEFRSQLS